MSHSNGYRNDLCSVCCQLEARDNSPYCSDKCKEVAHRFRERMASTVKMLKANGFQVEWKHAVQLSISMPQSSREFYPKAVHNIFWPGPCFAVEACNSEGLYEELKHSLGTLTAKWLLLFGDQSQSSVVEGEALFRTFAGWANFYAESSFDCGCCHKHFIKSDATFDTTIGCCIDCSIERIPF